MVGKVSTLHTTLNSTGRIAEEVSSYNEETYETNWKMTALPCLRAIHMTTQP